MRAQLKQESVGAGLCCYCEQNEEATDIEHILPKSLFPQQTFVADNYLLACKTCNTGHKLDKMAVFVPAGSVVNECLARQEEPASQDVALFTRAKKTQWP
ncbi:MAG: HNH endonuclease domain-containing protein [Rivihabitans pingtungensis]